MSDLKENRPQLLAQEHLDKNLNYITTDMVGRQFEFQGEIVAVLLKDAEFVTLVMLFLFQFEKI